VAGVGTLFYNRGSFPNSPDSGSIIVGALNNDISFTRAEYSNFGPAIDVFSPGTAILSAFGNTGLPDSKYGAGNYWFPISGTSMASPQVTGIAACLASGKPRFTNADVLGFLNSASIYNDMTFDVNGGGFDDDTCSKGSPNKYLHIENPRRNVGYLTEVVGQRTSGMTFPRPNMYNVPVT
jgi:subtilisin family serine protease